MLCHLRRRVLYTAHYNIIIYRYDGPAAKTWRRDNNNRTLYERGTRRPIFRAGFRILLKARRCRRRRPARGRVRPAVPRMIYAANPPHEVWTTPISFQLGRDGRVLKFMNVLCCTPPPRRSLTIRYYNVREEEYCNIYAPAGACSEYIVCISDTNYTVTSGIRANVQYTYIIIICPRLNVCLWQEERWWVPSYTSIIYWLGVVKACMIMLYRLA